MLLHYFTNFTWENAVQQPEKIIINRFSSSSVGDHNLVISTLETRFEDKNVTHLGIFSVKSESKEKNVSFYQT